MDSHFAYGINEGWPRIRALLRHYGVKATLNSCGRAVATHPWLAREAAADGHEISAHGWRWETHAGMDEETERFAIARTVEAIEAATGRPPVGWHTRSATSINTRRLLIEHGGFLYDSNAYDADVPPHRNGTGATACRAPLCIRHQRHALLQPGGFVFAEDFARYCRSAFDRLHAEAAERPRMLSIGLHLRIIGRPARIGGLDQLLCAMATKPGVWFARRDEIARAWLQARPEER